VNRAIRAVNTGSAGCSLYERIGNFLLAQRLDPEPGNYAFAHAVLANPDGALARAVNSLTDGGVRLTRQEIQSLGSDVAVSPKEARARADGLVAQAQMHVESFDDTLQAMRARTQDFGRDLAASADAIRASRDGTLGNVSGVDELVRITAAMVDRVRSAEAELEHATREASELRSKLDEARDNARRDPLTDLPNRRAFEEAFAKCAAAGETLCLAVCDIDHFKQVNDRFGHVVGDRVLKAIGSSLLESCEGHLVARHGGEEFVVLFSGVNMATARATLDGARDAVASRRFRLRESDAPLGQISFSAGLTTVVLGELVATAFNRADRLLYGAKESGRNNVKVG